MALQKDSFLEMRLHDTKIIINEEEVTFHPIRAQGPGGQHVNKASSAIRLRFDIGQSSLPVRVKEALMALNDRRISSTGIINIKSQEHRSLIKNKQEALKRLEKLIERAARKKKKRVPTNPSKGAKERRLRDKQARGGLKKLRGKPGLDS